MPITLPSLVAPNEVIESAWGNAVVDALDELDDEKLDLAGGTMTGQITAAGAPTADGHLARKSYVDNQDGLKLDLAGGTMSGQITAAGAPTADGHLARKSYVDNNDNLKLDKAGDTMTGDLQTGGDPSAAAGNLVRTDGAIETSLTATGGATTSTSNIIFGRGGTPGNDTGIYCSFRRSASSSTPRQTQIGSITVNGSTAVAFNTTSDERVKTVIGAMSDEDVAAVLRVLEPVWFTMDDEPDRERFGFVAQHLAAAWPAALDIGAVTPGVGEPGDEDFIPWTTDLSKLTPLLTAGWQAIDRRLAALESAP